MKRKNIFVLAASMLLLAACGNNSSSQPQSQASSTPAATSSAQTTAQDESSSSRSSRTRTSSSSSSSQAPSAAELPSSLPEIAGTEVGYVEDTRSGGEAVAAQNPGYLYCWAGDGGTMYSFNKKGEDYVLEYGIGWAWYGVQVFYDAPYVGVGETVNVRLLLKTDAAGSITINGTVVELVLGWNVVTFEATKAAADKTLVSIQLGVNGSDTSFLGTQLRIRTPEIYDATNTYHLVKFINGEVTAKQIQVRDGRTVTAPKITAPEGKVLEGWFNGDAQFVETTPITAPVTFTARFADLSQAVQVTYHIGEHVIGTQPVVSGAAAVFDGDGPVGYEILGWYTDAALTTAYNSEPVTANIDLYAKARVSPSRYIHNNQCAVAVSYDADGNFKANLKDHGFSDGWNIQFNFDPMPQGEAGKNYVFTVDYRLTGAAQPGNVQAYDQGASSGVEGSVAEVSNSGNWATYTFRFAGMSFSDSTKVTFELGLVHPVDAEAGMDFELRNPWLAVAQ